MFYTVLNILTSDLRCENESDVGHLTDCLLLSMNEFFHKIFSFVNYCTLFVFSPFVIFRICVPTLFSNNINKQFKLIFLIPNLLPEALADVAVPSMSNCLEKLGRCIVANMLFY